ncbi:MAG TPA: hypothetical protein VFN59_06170 [Acidimicrobiales bacterium]|nr:hypothetical protein [Acidimicrobiales bacterium]
MRASERDRLDRLVEEITVDCYDALECLTSFVVCFDEVLEVDSAARLFGLELEVLKVDAEGQAERGLAARCRLASGETGTVSLVDLAFAPSSEAAWYHAGYRWWLGLEPFSYRVPEGWAWPEWLESKAP